MGLSQAQADAIGKGITGATSAIGGQMMKDSTRAKDEKAAQDTYEANLRTQQGIRRDDATWEQQQKAIEAQTKMANEIINNPDNTPEQAVDQLLRNGLIPPNQQAEMLSVLEDLRKKTVDFDVSPTTPDAAMESIKAGAPTMGGLAQPEGGMSMEDGSVVTPAEGHKYWRPALTEEMETRKIIDPNYSMQAKGSIFKRGLDTQEAEKKDARELSVYQKKRDMDLDLAKKTAEINYDYKVRFEKWKKTQDGKDFPFDEKWVKQQKETYETVRGMTEEMVGDLNETMPEAGDEAVGGTEGDISKTSSMPIGKGGVSKLLKERSGLLQMAQSYGLDIEQYTDKETKKPMWRMVDSGKFIKGLTKLSQDPQKLIQYGEVLSQNMDAVKQVVKNIKKGKGGKEQAAETAGPGAETITAAGQTPQPGGPPTMSGMGATTTTTGVPQKLPPETAVSAIQNMTPEQRETLAAEAARRKTLMQ